MRRRPGVFAAVWLTDVYTAPVREDPELERFFMKLLGMVLSLFLMLSVISCGEDGASQSAEMAREQTRSATGGADFSVVEASFAQMQAAMA
ncbi:MAG: hypothetical protein AMJ66_10120, partial [Betaproteobacteria bacterium SG8_40]